MGAEIRPGKVSAEGKKQIYFIDQFHWFVNGLECGSAPSNITRRSAVSFVFPYSPGKLSRAELLVLGQSSELEAYFLSVNDKNKNTIQRLFNYPSYKDKIDKKIINLDAVPSPNIFTTQETPFLFRGEGVSDFSREYFFNLFGGEYFQVIAQRNEPSKFDYMELKYLPDSKDGRSITLSRIINDGKRWFIENK